jgi:uncharacterized protein (DUF2267 family)
MRYGMFLAIVEEVSGLLHHHAERSAHAVLWVLGWRVGARDAEGLAAFLPAELRRTLADAPEPAQAFGLDEFVRRVAKLEVVDEMTALEHARAVFVALGQAVAPGELRDPAAQLPTDYEPLLRAADAGRRAAQRARTSEAAFAFFSELDRERGAPAPAERQPAPRSLVG